ncbi:MAG: hypothetical protein LBT33_07360 [Spirochaetia bacterium]|jgi:hypothetical protein|nr:hypothetical protein [Spirochaetia bacterium]
MIAKNSSFLKKFLRVFVFAFFLSASQALFAQNPPAWYFDTEAEYPRERYITAVGNGASRKEAEDAAVAALSLFFQTKADVRNDMIREYNETLQNGKGDFSRNTKISESAIITSQTEFLGVNFAPLFQNGQDFSALAYINREEIVRIYDSRIQTNLTLMDTLVQAAEKSADPLSAVGRLRKAQTIAKLTAEYVSMAAIVNPDAASRYGNIPRLSQQIQDLLTKNRPRLTASVVCEPAAHQRVGRKMNEVLEARGFTIVNSRPAYIVSVKVTATEEDTPAAKFVRPALDVKISLASKKTVLFSYTKNLSRSGHASLEGAYGRAYLNMESDLEENFVSEFYRVFGFE